MHQQFSDACNTHWPELSESERKELMWCCCGFPAGIGQPIEKQVLAVIEQSGRDLGEAMLTAEKVETEAYEDMMETMANQTDSP